MPHGKQLSISTLTIKTHPPTTAQSLLLTLQGGQMQMHHKINKYIKTGNQSL